jgi:hypothetical protein
MWFPEPRPARAFSFFLFFFQLLASREEAVAGRLQETLLNPGIPATLFEIPGYDRDHHETDPYENKEYGDNPFAHFRAP